jgi:hypothetical protein
MASMVGIGDVCLWLESESVMDLVLVLVLVLMYPDDRRRRQTIDDDDNGKPQTIYRLLRTRRWQWQQQRSR